MKKLRILILIFPVVLLASACKKYLDQQPISDLSNDLFWRTPDDALLGITGVYDGVQSAIGTGFYTDWGDARSDNFTYSGTGDNQINLALNGLTASSPSTDWNDIYVTIGRANTAIKYIPRINGLSETLKNDYLAQAHALRAFMYFYLVRVWGDVPVRLTPYEDLKEELDLKRVPVSQVIDEVILPDLNLAYTLSNKAKISVFDISTGAILAMLTDVYMWTKNYPKALEESGKLIQLNRYGLVPAADWKKLFTAPGTTSVRENIWTLDWNFLVDQEGNGNNNFQRIGLDGNTSTYQIDLSTLAKFESDKKDIRRALTYDTLLITTNSLGVDKIGKFYPLGDDGRPDYPTRELNEAKIPIYRYADILLLRAEALNKTSADKTEAIAIVNQIRRRANAKEVNPANYTTEREVETLILNERQLELFAEGRRWFDLIRTDRVLEVMDPLIRERQAELNQDVTGFTDARKILFPISRTALNRNPALVQNPPYSE